MKQTIQDRLAEALTARGEREIIPSKSSKYRQFTRSGSGFYWLGRSGALRHGQNSSSSYSMPASIILDAKKHHVEAAAKLVKADAEWLVGHQELASNLTGDLDEHQPEQEGYIAGTRAPHGSCRCDRCRTIRALRRMAEQAKRDIFATCAKGNEPTAEERKMGIR